jgi:hypothetical protein
MEAIIMEIERKFEKESTGHPQTSQQFDFKRILKLILDPLSSLKLSDKDFRYGIIGLASAYVGFLIWSLFVTKRINALLNPFYELASFFNGGSKGSAFFPVFSKLMVTGLWSTIALLGVVWLVSWLTSGNQPAFKSFLTRIGGIHYIGGVGYLLACIFSASFTFSIIIVLITLLTLLMLTLYAGATLFGVTREKLSLYFIVSIAGYVLLFSFIPQLLF